MKIEFYSNGSGHTIIRITWCINTWVELLDWNNWITDDGFWGRGGDKTVVFNFRSNWGKTITLNWLRFRGNYTPDAGMPMKLCGHDWLYYCIFPGDQNLIRLEDGVNVITVQSCDRIISTEYWTLMWLPIFADCGFFVKGIIFLGDCTNIFNANPEMFTRLWNFLKLSTKIYILMNGKCFQQLLE